MSAPDATVASTFEVRLSGANLDRDEIARRARELLNKALGPDATFRPHQLEAIMALAADRRRVLLVQRTGWGKSAVYFFATRLLRDQGSGPTILISPLLALMRNQMQMADRLGVSAATINSSNRDAWETVIADLKADRIDLLLVSPERFNNREFLDDVLPELAGKTGMLVVDEVHCISDWGHDFRPDYRRVGRLLDRMPSGIPVLGATATANDRVMEDVVAQLGGGIEAFRGDLGREGLALHAFDIPAPSQRLAWLAQALPDLQGSGIVYCLTVADTVRVANWLRQRGIDAVAYSGNTEADEREHIEADLLDNRVKVVVATSALGMGFDKPNLSFVIHFQAPGSPIGYYQQVGRAGRALPKSVGVLLRGREDSDIQDYFIRNAFPPQSLAEKVIAHLEEQARPLRLNEIMATVNLRRSRLEQMLKILEVEGVVERIGSGYRRTLKRWTYPTERVEGVTAARKREQEVMQAYATTSGCLMEFLGRELDDPNAAPCGICMNCSGSRISVQPDRELVVDAVEFLRRQPIPIEPRRNWPLGLVEPSGRIPEDLRLENGRALCRLGDGGWSDLVRAGKYEDGAFAEELVDAAVRLIREWAPTPAPAWITYVPSLTRETLVADLAAGLGRRLGLPVQAVVQKVSQNSPQKEMQNSAQQYRNVADCFRVVGPVSAEPVLLVDDLFDSRWTLTVVGAALRQAGSGLVFPFALAAAVGT